MWTDLLTQLEQSQAFLEMYGRAWALEYAAGGGTVHCTRGCSACCSLMVNCALTEAVRLAPRLDPRQREAVNDRADLLRSLAGRHGDDLKGFLAAQRRQAGPCPLLDDGGACSVYPYRPLSCRALLSTRESVWCGTDFTTLSTDAKQAYLSGLDRGAVAFPTHYGAAARETGEELEARTLALMGRAFGFSLYGSLPVLLHLVLDHGLAERCADGAAAVEALLARTGSRHPLLATLERTGP